MSDLKKESAEEMSNYSMHMADSGTDNFDRDSALSLLSSDQDAVYEIEEAIKKKAKEVTRIHQALHVDYDRRTNHGKSQGARFP